MKVKFFLLLIAVFFIGCKTKPFQFPKMIYKNAHNHDEYVFYINGEIKDSADSLVLYDVVQMQSNKNVGIPIVKSGETFEFDSLFSTGSVRYKRDYKIMNKYYKKSVPNLRIIAFSVDSTLQHYSICLDTVVVNSKDSVYIFHSN